MSEYTKPWETDLSGESARFFPNEYAMEAYEKRFPNQVKILGIIAVGLTWTKPEQDYVSAFIGDRRIMAYGQEEIATWLSGVALSEERKRVLHLSNRERGSFEDLVGWRPLTVVKWEPNPEEEENFIDYETAIMDAEWEHLLDE
jgi:hypothetical protein